MTSLTSLQFLQRVWPSSLLTNETLEMRAIDRITHKVTRRFASSVSEFLEFAESYRNLEVYFGVSTRFMQGGKKENCYRVKTLWADLDNRKLSECKFPVQPDIIVESGTGIHAYWLLKSPVLVKDDRWERIESINRGLCRKLSGDITTIDVSRILRVPEFLNHKYSPAKPVRAYAL